MKSVSPRFGRKRIGQFGIGKFSALSLADQFIVQSVKGNYKYSVIFDKADWKASVNWDLPITKEKITPFDKEGTKVILNKLKKKISLTETEKYLKQSVPLKAKKFSIYKVHKVYKVESMKIEKFEKLKKEITKIQDTNKFQ